jgi:hypothetical protein
LHLKIVVGLWQLRYCCWAINQEIGELGEGGAGFDFAIARWDVSNMGSVVPLGDTVELGSWSEAESFNLDGTLKYHHFAFDRIDSSVWVLPAQ